MNNTSRKINLGEDNLGALLWKFAPPAIAANIINALYNLVDQIFIGQGVGYLGNAATNVAFPLSTLIMSLTLLIAVGSSTTFNIAQGMGDKQKAKDVTTTCFTSIVLVGVLLVIGVKLFLDPILWASGATVDNIEYARTYVSITSWGFPFLMIGIAFNQLIRADGSPVYSMFCIMTGALLNTAFDPLFMFVFKMGIAGAAWATVLSQIIAFFVGAAYLPRFKTISLKLTDFTLKPAVLFKACPLGISAFFNNITNLVVQMTLNNLLRKYGEMSDFGPDIPLAVSGVVIKLNFIFFGVLLGISHGCQPIHGFNIGAKKYKRVLDLYAIEIKLTLLIGIIGELIFMIFPTQILSVFGADSDLYMQYGENYMRFFFALTIFNGLQAVSSMFCAQIGQAGKAAILAVLRQIVLYIPALFAFTGLFGIKGIWYASPVSDGLSFIVAFITIMIVLKNLQKLKEDQEQTKIL